MLDLTPENRILRQQADSLRKDFSELFEQWNYMLTYEESALNALYLNEIGGLQFEVHRLTTELAHLKHKIQLAQAYFNRNVQPDWATIDQQLAHQLAEYQRKLKEEAARLSVEKAKLQQQITDLEKEITEKTNYLELLKTWKPESLH
jgi:predicted RNase H-like nuclease (RuvC/YqgF family)